MKLSIGLLASVGVALVTAAVIGVMSGLILRAHQDALTAQLTRHSDQVSETIAGAMYYDMLENRRDALHRQIGVIGRQEGIERLRLINKAGEVMFSSDPEEIGHALDKRAEACYACHAADQPLDRLPIDSRARIYRAADGHRILGMIRPIPNDPSCWNADCHAHTSQQAVLGVLDVNVSLAEVDRRVAHDRRQLLLLAAIAIAASSLLLLALSRWLILRPVGNLIAGTRRVASGDLSTTIQVSSLSELGGLALAFNDMTVKLNEAQRQLTQSDKLASVGRLAAGVAHEINNPLTGVLTYASFLLKRSQGNPEAEADLEVIVRETKRCREIVRGLLDFARQTPPRRQPIDLNEVVRRAATVVVNQLSLARIRLGFELAPDLAPVPADANQIQQVLVNLLLNAADAIAGAEESPGGTITVRSAAVAVPPRGHVTIRAARCPKGCDLLDKSVRLAGAPTIRVLCGIGGREFIAQLDPLYGRVNHRMEMTCDDGVIGTHLCPSCRVPLELPDRTCETCGAPLFAALVPDAGQVEWCSRKGCAHTRWEAMDARGPQAYAQLQVEDTGRGIPAEELNRIFEPFFSTKGTRGTGLGLAVTWGIIEGHGGAIDVASRVGEGTCFTIRLPLQVPEPGDAGSSATDLPGGRAPMPDARGRVGPGPAAPIAPRITPRNASDASGTAPSSEPPSGAGGRR